MSITTRELLEKMCDFHYDLSDYYRERYKKMNNLRTRLLVDYMVEREKNLAESLAAFAKTTSKEIMDYNFKYSPEIKTEEWFKEVESSVDMTIEEFLKIVLNFDEHLILVYKQLASEAESEGVKNLFNHLVITETREKKLAALNANEMIRI